MILLATPTRAEVTVGFTGDLVKLIRRRPDVRFAAPIGIYIANLRQQAVRLAQQMGASHLVFIDADMRFPEDTVDRLLASQVEIVAANYVQRTMPEWWVARTDGVSVSSVGQRGLEAVDSVGCGVMCLARSVFDTVPSPWFSTPYNGQDHTGEDVYFCHRARAHGLSVWIDHDLSQHVRHQATVEYGVGSDVAHAVA